MLPLLDRLTSRRSPLPLDMVCSAGIDGGVAGMIVDGASDPIWWPAFLVGGILLGGVAWMAGTRGVGGGPAAAERSS